jgi:hypothetical protein
MAREQFQKSLMEIIDIEVFWYLLVWQLKDHLNNNFMFFLRFLRVSMAIISVFF